MGPNMLAALKSRLPQSQAQGADGTIMLASQPLEEPFLLKVGNDQDGLSRPFAAGEYLIGRRTDADIIIPALDLDDVANIRLEQVGQAGLITIIPLAGGVMARGRELGPGENAVFTDKASFSVRGFAFEAIYNPSYQPVAVKSSSKPILFLAGAFLAALGAYFASGSRPSIPVSSNVQSQKKIDTTGIDNGLNLAEISLKNQLASSNLVPPLRVSRDNVSLVVTGLVNADERNRTMETVTTFKERNKVPVEMRLTSDPDPGSFVVAVSLKPETYVMGKDGRRYTLRQRLPDGSVIEAIDDKYVTLDRDGLREKVTYIR